MYLVNTSHLYDLCLAVRALVSNAVSLGVGPLACIAGDLSAQCGQSQENVKQIQGTWLETSIDPGTVWSAAHVVIYCQHQQAQLLGV